ncbi:MAG: sel1 repeat family protein [Kordiimonadaceae bacterium]|jgi:hypothetical protein|nr:sel1 repeat family protein [Kordiimonadaceae bacterium]MBT6033588.1 sel1 repeat family protein [Kordiimonadaceae bacterium]
MGHIYRHTVFQENIRKSMSKWECIILKIRSICGVLRRIKNQLTLTQLMGRLKLSYLILMLPLFAACSHGPTCVGNMPDHLKGGNYDAIMTSDVEGKKVVNFLKCRANERWGNEAGYRLGQVYEFGQLGMVQNDDRAFSWYKKASKKASGLEWTYGSEIAIRVGPDTHGHPAAQYKLGLMYLEGRGTDQSDDMARLWLGTAAGQGYEPAKLKLVEIQFGRNS